MGMKPQVQKTGYSQEHSAQGNLSRRAFTHGSVASENGGEKLDHRAAILSRVRAERN